jgi:YVTN family beta-propeller protein
MIARVVRVFGRKGKLFSVVISSLGVVAGVAPNVGQGDSAALPHGARLTAEIKIPGSGGLAAGEGAIWTMSTTTATLSRIDAQSNAVAAQIKVPTANPCPPSPEVCDEIAAGDNAVWISLLPDDSVARVDPAAGKVAATISVGHEPEGITVSAAAVWVANRGGPSLSRIDPSTNQVVATIQLAPKGRCCSSHMEVTVSRGAVWVALPELHQVVRVDQATNKIAARITISPRWGQACAFITADANGVWAAGDHCAPTVTRIDPRTNKPSGRVPGLEVPLGLGLGFGSLWIADLYERALIRVDPETGRPVGRLGVGGYPARLTIGFGSIWIRDDTGRLLRFAPTR